MYITARERLILSILLESPHLFISLNDLSTALDVSLRTVQREVKVLEDTLASLDLAIGKRMNEGIRLEGSEESLEKLKKNLRNYGAMDLEKHERGVLLYHELFKATDGLKSEYLGSVLGISQKTLKQDLDALSEEIRHSRLKILRKPGYGISLEGEEKDQRMVFVNLILQRLEQSPIFSLKEGELISLEKEDPILTMVEAKTMEEIQRILLDEVSSLDFTLTDLALFELILYLDLSLKRKERLPKKKEMSRDPSPELLVTQTIYQRMEKVFSCELPKEEVLFFYKVLRSAKRVRHQEIEENMALTLLANEFIDEVSKATGYYYSKDKKFFDALVSHLEPLLNRIEEGITVLNPIKEEIKEAYGTLYGTLERILKEKFLGKHISEDEVGFLTLHFASAITELHHAPKVSTLVLCTSGIATSRMLTKKLLQRFPQLTIIEQGSIWELRKMDLGAFDLIISTVGIKDATFSYIQVSPMLTPEDEKKLERVVNQKLLRATQKKTQETSTTPGEKEGAPSLPLAETAGMNTLVEELLAGFRYQVLQGQTLEETLEEMKEYVELGEAKASVFTMLLKKTQEVGAGLPGTKIALVHGRHPLVQHPRFHVYGLKAPISILGMDQRIQEVDRVLLLLAGEAMKEVELELLSSISISLLEKDTVQIFQEGSVEAMDHHIRATLKKTYVEIINRLWR